MGTIRYRSSYVSDDQLISLVLNRDVDILLNKGSGVMLRGKWSFKILKPLTQHVVTSEAWAPTNGNSFCAKAFCYAF